MQKTNFLDAVVANKLLEEQQDNKRQRELVGRLSGSILGSPLLFQLLHMIGVPEKSIDEYVLRKFQRGHHVEAWIMEHLPGIIPTPDDKQHDIIYRGVTGHIDAVVDMKEWDMPKLGIIPHEVKSVTNLKYKRIEKSGGADWQHQMQAGMYALALNADHFMIHYVASDDYRISSMLYETKEIAADIDRVIDEVLEQLATGKLPVFVARLDWQNNKDYQNYPAWSELTEDQVNKKLKKEYPHAYKRLQSLAASMEGGD